MQALPNQIAASHRGRCTVVVRHQVAFAGERVDGGSDLSLRQRHPEAQVWSESERHVVQAGPGDVVVRIVSAGLCHSDLSVIENLRAEGLDATLFSQSDRSFPMDLGELSIARVLVPTFEYAQALQLIREYMDTEGEVVFACPGCGEVYEPGQETCANCGASLVG